MDSYSFFSKVESFSLLGIVSLVVLSHVRRFQCQDLSAITFLRNHFSFNPIFYRSTVVTSTLETSETQRVVSLWNKKQLSVICQVRDIFFLASFVPSNGGLIIPIANWNNETFKSCKQADRR